MTTLQFDLKSSDVYAYLKDIPKGVKRAASRAMNSMNRDIREEASQSIVGIYNMRQTDAKKGVKLVRRSGPNSLYVIWRGQGRPIPLKSYGAQLVGGGKRSNAPVSVQVMKGRRKTVRGGFLGPNGHVFRRIGKARLPIKKLYGPGLPTAFAKEQVHIALVKLSNAVLPKRIESEMVRELRRVATGVLPK